MKQNFTEEDFANKPQLQSLYEGFIKMMDSASESSPPDHSSDDVPLDDDFNVSQEYLNSIQQELDEYNQVMRKNQSYAMAKVIADVYADVVDSSMLPTYNIDDYLKIEGGSMEGLLEALNGFVAGVKDETILSVAVDGVSITGKLTASSDIQVDGNIQLGSEASISYADGTMTLDAGVVKLNTEKLVIGNTIISGDGITSNGLQFYHSGNANLSTIDWNMKDGYVNGNLDVKGSVTALGGVSLGYGNRTLLTTSEDVVAIDADLALLSGHKFTMGDATIISIDGSSILLGDSTKYITLQSDLRNNTDIYTIVSKNGDGNFKNSLNAGCGNAVDSVLQTYYLDKEHYGVYFSKHIALDASHKVLLSGFDTGLKLTLNGSESTFTTDDNVVVFDTDKDFVRVNKTLESTKFSIVSSKHTTYLTDNVLFFGDGRFIEGTTDGLIHTGNAYFTGKIGSQSFASGFAGYGWRIGADNGSIAATFDNLTIRKKMRVYELEVQSIKATNGSMWVSDSCSGDKVELLN
jgi:hypothetical protein